MFSDEHLRLVMKKKLTEKGYACNEETLKLAIEQLGRERALPTSATPARWRTW